MDYLAYGLAALVLAGLVIWRGQVAAQHLAQLDADPVQDDPHLTDPAPRWGWLHDKRRGG